MIIACTVKETGSYEMHPRFGRCGALLLHNTETREDMWIMNEQNVHALQGAGIQTAEKIVNFHADAVITGHCGPKAFAVLSAAEKKVYLYDGGSVHTALKNYKEGALLPQNSADVAGHWV